MKIVNLCFHDSGGGAYTLSHAINKLTKHKAINLRSTGDYLRFPTIASMGNYTVTECRNMVYKADVIVYHTVVKPYFIGLSLDQGLIRDKKNILFFHGGDLRHLGEDIKKEADESLENYQILVSTADLLWHAPKGAKWLPTARSFSEIRRRYGLCNQDRRALRTFIKAKKKVMLSHAPTGEYKKGSNLFYRVITQIVKTLPYVSFKPIRHQPWANVLRILPDVDVMFDSNPPEGVETTYGNIAVEASILKIPTVTKLTKRTLELLKSETGLDSPFVTFDDEEDLLGKVLMLAENEKLRRIIGNKAYRYCKAVHDEKPVVERFLKIVGQMR